MLLFYPAVIHKDADSDCGVSFPDFPGCITAGATQSEAMVMAKEALAMQIEGLIEDGEAIPGPSSVDLVQQAVARDTGFSSVTLVEVALPGPSKRITQNLIALNFTERSLT